MAGSLLLVCLLKAVLGRSLHARLRPLYSLYSCLWGHGMSLISELSRPRPSCNLYSAEEACSLDSPWHASFDLDQLRM